MIIVEITNGFGNNIFQYVAGRLLAEHHGVELKFVTPDNYYAIPDLKKIGLTNFITYKDLMDMRNTHSFRLVNEQNYVSCFRMKLGKEAYILRGYFEDYTYYINSMNTIKSWFPEVDKRKNNDLVVHFRTGDTLIQKDNFPYKPSAKKWVKLMEKFDFDKLHIVSDFPKWEYTTKEEIESMGGFHNNAEFRQIEDKQESADYINSCIDAFAKFSPIFKHGNIYDDFNYVRSFDNILFQHGTLGWWGAALSDATKVGVYGPWRPWKGASNKNLGYVPLEGWFQWS